MDDLHSKASSLNDDSDERSGSSGEIGFKTTTEYHFTTVSDRGDGSETIDLS